MSTFRTFAEPGPIEYERPRKPPYNARGRAIALVASVILISSFLIGYASFIGWPAWPVIDASERIVYSAIGILVFAVAAEFFWRCILRLPMNVLAVLACIVPTGLPMVRPTDWTMTQFVVGALLIAIVVGLVINMAQRLASRDGSLLMPLVLLGMSVAGGGLLLMTGSLKLGEAGFSLAAGALIVAIVGCFVTPFRKSAGAPLVVIATLAGLFVSGHLWSNLPIWAGVCVLVAPAIAWVVRLPILQRRSTWMRVLIALLLAATPAIAASAVLGVKAYQDAQREAADPSSDYGY